MFNSKYANARPDGTFSEIPNLMVGFDTETTGLFMPPKHCECPDHRGQNIEVRDCPRTAPGIIRLDTVFPTGEGARAIEAQKDMSIHEPISYGFKTYIKGKPAGEDTPDGTQNFLALPDSYALKIMDADPQKFAERTHGFSSRMLQSSYNGRYIPNGWAYDPATDRTSAMTRAVQRLAEADRRGATFVGANIGFDFGMLGHHFKKTTGMSMKDAGFDLDKALDEGRVLDVIRHHQLMTGEEKRRPLSSSKINSRKFKDTLCDLYGVREGDHSAAEDSRASIDVALRQIATNNGQFTPNPPRIG